MNPSATGVVVVMDVVVGFAISTVSGGVITIESGLVVVTVVIFINLDGEDDCVCE